MTRLESCLPATAALMLCAAAFVGRPALARDACRETAHAMFRACHHEVEDDYWVAKANCFNVPDAQERQECLAEAAVERTEALEECTEVGMGRRDFCEEVGQEPYDPEFDPVDFVPTKEGFNNANDYFPLAIGNEWHYEGDGELIDVMVLDASKLIEGVTCIVVNDKVYEEAEENAEAELIEDTDDWYAQNLDGSVYYCGEIAKDYETFEGDIPPDPELIEIEGSFKHGRDSAKTGVNMLAVPQEGDIYRQEFALGEAEDGAEVLSDDYVYGEDPELDEFMPQELAEALCSESDPCLVTSDFNLLEPDSEEWKYYAKGIGTFLEVDPETGDTVELVSCNLPACANLP